MDGDGTLKAGSGGEQETAGFVPPGSFSPETSRPYLFSTAQRHPQYGCRRVWVRLIRRRYAVNRKGVCRAWHKAGLSLSCRRFSRGC
jgi:hypothetical protein